LRHLQFQAPDRDPITVGVRPHQSRGLGAFLSPLAGLGLLIAACSSPTEPSGPPPLLEALPRALSTAESAAIAANNQFAFQLLQRVVGADPAENTFIAPLSVSLALGMVMDGARGPTRDAMAATLGFGALPQPEINEAFRTLMALFGGLDEQIDFIIANSIWTAAGYPVEAAFLDDARRYFDAEARSLDFASASALATINGWVNDKTKGRIPTILDRIDDAEVLFAVNAIYFKGLWRTQFKKSETASGAFHAADGTTRTVPFMHRTEDTPFYRGADFEAVDLWYGNGAFTMTVIVPSGTATATSLATRLTAADFQAIAAGLHDTKVDLAMPRLRLEYARSLGDDLIALGMGIGFDSRLADFSGIGPNGPFITRVEHKTFVAVDEEGTEAAAATAVGVGVTSVPQTETVRVDRPFLIAIRERLSVTIVFLGRINDIPAA
jgi:serpin B